MMDTLLLAGVLLLLGCTLPPCEAFVLPAARSISAASIATASLKSPISGGRTLYRTSHTPDRLRAGHGDGAAKEGVSIDVFDALMSGDVAAVKEYVNAGGDCSVQDSIGERMNKRGRKERTMFPSTATPLLPPLCLRTRRTTWYVRGMLYLRGLILGYKGYMYRGKVGVCDPPLPTPGTAGWSINYNSSTS